MGEKALFGAEENDKTLSNPHPTKNQRVHQMREMEEMWHHLDHGKLYD